MPEDLWSRVRACFDTDDGSLPGIEIARLSPMGLTAIYRMLRGRSRLAGDARFWCHLTDANVPVDSVTDAALRVATHQAEAFHVLISGVTIREVVLPDLGVFVWPDCIELDYRMGPEWGPSEVAGFFELLRECCALEPAAAVAPSHDSPPHPDRFMAVWQTYWQGSA